MSVNKRSAESKAPTTDFNRELSSKVKDQILWRSPIIKFTRDVYACPVDQRVEG